MPRRMPRTFRLDDLPNIFAEVRAQAEENIAQQRTLEDEIEHLWIEELESEWNVFEHEARKLLKKVPDLGEDERADGGRTMTTKDKPEDGFEEQRDFWMEVAAIAASELNDAIVRVTQSWANVTTTAVYQVASAGFAPDQTLQQIRDILIDEAVNLLRETAACHLHHA